MSEFVDQFKTTLFTGLSGLLATAFLAIALRLLGFLSQSKEDNLN